MKSIAVIGQGFVGGSLTTVFAERGSKVYAYDKAGNYVPAAYGLPGSDWVVNVANQQIAGFPTCVKDLVTNVESHAEDFTGVYFVCLPTPMNADGSADLSIVDGVLSELASIPGERVAVVKSTVPPGSTEEWNKKFVESGLSVVFNPEFLTEANAVNDMRSQDRIILGGSDRKSLMRVKKVYDSAFPGVPLKLTSSTVAEMVKYVANVHLTVKVALANEFYQICENLTLQGHDISYDEVIEYATLDKRLGTSHWQVPGPMPADDTRKPAFGFGGSCFVKDINALIAVARSLGIDPKVMSGAWEKNLEVRPQRDWEKLKGRAVSNKE
jgi:nucleotide sugar dehydrogenase